MGQVNIRVPDGKVVELRERLRAVADGLGVSQAEAVERGLERLVEKREAVSDGDISRWFRETWTRLEEILEMLQSAPSEYEPPLAREPGRVAHLNRTDPRDVPGVETGVRPNAFCVHCQTKFMGPKGASICSACGRGGHVSSGECRRCAQMAHAKELASSPTAAEGVDYDWQDPI